MIKNVEEIFLNFEQLEETAIRVVSGRKTSTITTRRLSGFA